MTQTSKQWWELSSQHYQQETDIPVGIHYGPGAPFEEELGVFERELGGQDVLEVGCGAANCSLGFTQRGCNVTAMDLSAEQLSHAQENVASSEYDVSLVQGDSRELPFGDASFDVVFSAYVFEWVDDWPATFAEANRVLRSDGVFVFSVPHPNCRMYDGEMNVEHSYFDSGRRVHDDEELDTEMVTYSYTIGEIFDFLIGAGFTVERVVEPDSRVPYEDDPWRGMWGYTEEVLSNVPATLIFKAKK